MPEEFQENWWDDKAIQIPKGLLTKDVSGEALAVYAKMKGFGKEVRCSLGALAMRLCWSEERVKKYQTELQEKGWIVLLLEGQNGQPRRWFMATYPGEKPTAELMVRMTMPPRVAEKYPLENPPPGKTTPETNKVLQTNKEVLKQAAKAAPAKHPDQDQFWRTIDASWRAHLQKLGLPPAALGWPNAKGFQHRMAAELTRVGWTELARRWLIYLKAEWPNDKSIQHFFQNTDKWVSEATQRRGGRYLAVGDTDDFKG